MYLSRKEQYTYLVREHISRQVRQIRLKSHHVVDNDVHHEEPIAAFPRKLPRAETWATVPKKRDVRHSSSQHSHAAAVDLVRQSLEVVGRSKPGVEFTGIGDPIAVVGVSVGCARTLIVLGDRADPN